MSNLQTLNQKLSQNLTISELIKFLNSLDWDFYDIIPFQLVTEKSYQQFFRQVFKFKDSYLTVDFSQDFGVYFHEGNIM